MSNTVKVNENIEIRSSVPKSPKEKSKIWISNHDEDKHLELLVDVTDLDKIIDSLKKLQQNIKQKYIVKFEFTTDQYIVIKKDVNSKYPVFDLLINDCTNEEFSFNSVDVAPNRVNDDYEIEDYHVFCDILEHKHLELLNLNTKSEEILELIQEFKDNTNELHINLELDGVEKYTMIFSYNGDEDSFHSCQIYNVEGETVQEFFKLLKSLNTKFQ